MKKNEFRTPLIQSGALLVVIVFIISLMPSGDGMGVGTVLGALISGIFKLFLFIIALALALIVSIAALIGIFLAAIAIQSPEKASAIYAATKSRILALLQQSLTCSNATTATGAVRVEPVDTGISQEEYDQMKERISSLQKANQQLQTDVTSLHSKNTQLQDDIHGLTRMVDDLKESETKVKVLIEELSAKVKEDPDTELKSQIQKLEEMIGSTNLSLNDLAGRLEALEVNASVSASDTQSGGIFSYIEGEDQRATFIGKVQEGVEKELTYAQFEEFLTENLPAELDKIIKDHPSLTKDYIRSMRK